MRYDPSNPNRTSKRPFWQLHLSTCIVLTLLVSVTFFRLQELWWCVCFLLACESFIPFLKVFISCVVFLFVVAFVCEYIIRYPQECIPKRAWFQIGTRTAIVLVLASGGMLKKNWDSYEYKNWYQEDVYDREEPVVFTAWGFPFVYSEYPMSAPSYETSHAVKWKALNRLEYSRPAIFLNFGFLIFCAIIIQAIALRWHRES